MISHMNYILNHCQISVKTPSLIYFYKMFSYNYLFYNEFLSLRPSLHMKSHFYDYERLNQKICYSFFASIPDD